jgi:hypothetical protein
LTRRRFRRDPTHALFADQSHSFPDNLVALFGHSRAWHYSAETAQSTAALASLRRPAHLDQLLGLFVRQLEVHDPEMGALTNGCE